MIGHVRIRALGVFDEIRDTVAVEIGVITRNFRLAQFGRSEMACLPGLVGHRGRKEIVRWPAFDGRESGLKRAV